MLSHHLQKVSSQDSLLQHQNWLFLDIYYIGCDGFLDPFAVDSITSISVGPLFDTFALPRDRWDKQSNVGALPVSLMMSDALCPAWMISAQRRFYASIQLLFLVFLDR